MIPPTLHSTETFENCDTTSANTKFENSKTTLDKLNRPLHDLRISVIDRCNLRCNYCMPAEEYHEHYSFLPRSEWLTFDEIERLCRLFSRLGVLKLRLTGGEPLLRENLSELILKLSKISNINDLTLTTNGILLSKYAQKLRSAGLKRITVSLDTLDDQIFQSMTGNRAPVDHVFEGIRAAEEAGFDLIKINAVIQKGINDHTILDLVRRFKGSGHILRFIEYMDVGNRNNWKPQLVMPSLDIVRIIDNIFPMSPIEPNYHGEVAERYQFKDGSGEIGFISSITQPFCGTCTRARLSTNGTFYTCLFASSGVDLKKPLREGATDNELLCTIKAVWQGREDRYSEKRFFINPTEQRSKKIEMYQIGG